MTHWHQLRLLQVVAVAAGLAPFPPLLQPENSTRPFVFFLFLCGVDFDNIEKKIGRH